MTSPYLGWGDAKKRTTVLAAPKNSLDNHYSFHLYSLYAGNCVGGCCGERGACLQLKDQWIPLSKYYGDITIISVYIRLALTIHCPQT